MSMIKMNSPLLFFIYFLYCIPGYAQNNDGLKKVEAKDSLRMNFVEKMQAFAKQSSKKSSDDFEADKASVLQIKTFDELSRTMQKANIYLKSKLDTTGTKTVLNEIDKYLIVAGDGVFTNKGTAQTFRNLTATSKILSQLLAKANTRKAGLELRQQEINNFRYQLDSLLSVPALFKFPTDSTTLMKYLQKIQVIAYETSPVDSALRQAGNNIQTLLNKVNLAAFKLQSSLEEIELYQKDMAENTFKREFTNIWDPEIFYRPFGEILDFSITKGLLTLSFYAENNAGRLVVLVLLTITSFVYLRSLKSIYVEGKLLKSDFEGQLVIRYPLLSAILLVFSLFQFVFLSPPFILNVILWSVSVVCLSVIFAGYVSQYWMRVWLLMVTFFVLACLGNLVLQASRMERWLMLVLSISGVIGGVLILLKGHRDELREKWIIWSIVFMVFLELASTIANIFGRYNFGKMLVISGFLNVVIAILFLWTVRLINEGLFLAFNVYSGTDRKLFYLNFEKVGKKAPAPFYILLIVGWIVLFGRNFPVFDYLSKPLLLFFTDERTLGSYTFTINNMLLFIVIMGTAVIISRVVSFFATDKHIRTGKDGKYEKPGIGSWLLLVRISILSTGLFLAVAASGIPVDRITIVLGALGVGIGFGLQTLVNNLVSGLIIAFEKPVNVGDIVDVDGQGGQMKSIGFRSSVISTWDGADVIMPNGDLLNAHLVNWSLGGNRKRVSILIGIAYDSDLEKCRKILTEILDNEPRITKNPGSVVQYEQFNNSSIDMKIFFWTKHIGDNSATKSDMIIKIIAAFKMNSIEISVPKQEIYLHHKRSQGDNLPDS
ncbi:mechanosensitive ion channel protein [Pedobacter antarcticus 4BY]|uniref:Mechanosensitive ion channel protein n=2 Tax=Pedobacter antarcticus TaxID=34086 RepID=A0A081PD92_9SPHI|nr:mechanosensitive ion channel domain-containing protein [Pedobacter antarcticus]KEQ28665.1 mechanosensitive ion channel protein [Pedobacter antarcticus 4BY]SFE88317.1 Small-conductance mechanosensitive channel [Pedobacter antarcticus]